MGRKDKETGEARECSRACLSTASCVVPPPAEFMTVCGRSFLSQIREFTSMVASQWAAKPFISWAQLKVNQTPVCSTCRSCGSLRTYLVAADARARRNGCSCKGTPPSPRREGSKITQMEPSPPTRHSTSALRRRLTTSASRACNPRIFH